MEAEVTSWLESPGGVEIGGSGFSATLGALVDEWAFFQAVVDALTGQPEQADA